MPSTGSKKLNPCPFAPSHLGPELSSSVSKCHGPGREQFAEEPSEDSERDREEALGDTRGKKKWLCSFTDQSRGLGLEHEYQLPGCSRLV